jgi:hypothetical protein
VQEASFETQSIGGGYRRWLIATGYWPLAIGRWLLAVGYWLLAIGY